MTFQRREGGREGERERRRTSDFSAAPLLPRLPRAGVVSPDNDNDNAMLCVPPVMFVLIQ